MLCVQAGASVPSGILLLGCSLATLQIRHIKPLSCLGLAVAKLIVMPVIGIGVVMTLVNAGVLDRSNKMLLFVLMFQGCTVS
jgi:auxin efflux carrier family protein